MASKSAEGQEPVTRGTGKLFADLGFPDAAERQVRLRLAARGTSRASYEQRRLREGPAHGGALGVERVSDRR